MVVDSRARISIFLSHISNDVVKECRMSMLVKEMDISRLIGHAQQIKEEKIKERKRENKRPELVFQKT